MKKNDKNEKYIEIKKKKKKKKWKKRKKRRKKKNEKKRKKKNPKTQTDWNHSYLVQNCRFSIKAGFWCGLRREFQFRDLMGNSKCIPNANSIEIPNPSCKLPGWLVTVWMTSVIISLFSSLIDSSKMCTLVYIKHVHHNRSVALSIQHDAYLGSEAHLKFFETITETKKCLLQAAAFFHRDQS